MRRISFWLLFFLLPIAFQSFAQVDTTLIYNNSTPYGSLDIRLANSSTWYYYLQEDKTFSFRESSPGVKTNTFFDMTSWDSSPYSQGNLREKNGAQDLYRMNYRLMKPDNYNASYAPGYPLLVMLHGLGESGNCSDFECHHADRSYQPNENKPPAPTNADHPLLNNDHHLTTGARYHLQAHNAAQGKLPNDPTLAAASFPGFILLPQNLNGWDPASTQDAIRIVRLLCKKYNIDENRIYIQGLSNGGHGVYETIKRAPWMFAAALTMSAIDDAFVNQQNMVPAISRIPLWIFQGGQDKNPYPQKTENYVKKFRDAGMVVRYTKYDQLGHGTWNTAYHEPDYFTWMLGRNSANIHSFSGATTICNSAGLKLEVPTGYAAYQWQLNNQTIAGANASTYNATVGGTYRARFSTVANPAEGQWNRWSDPIVIQAGQSIPQASIKQIGTVVLPDLNNNANARLEAVGDFGHYYWYKNGALVDFPGDQDDTLKVATIVPSMGNGAYTLVTSNFDNCKSPVSAAKNIFFNNSAPLTITAPSNVSATVSSTDVTLNWADASTNESGFEIWRRRKADASTFTPWEMATLTPANTTTFKDAGLYPQAGYQYKIRAVSSSGRSNYSPDGTASVEITTGTDTQLPTVPKNLSVLPMGVRKMKLSWNRSTDNTGIKDYMVYFNNDSVSTLHADTTFILNNLALNTAFTFKVRARDLAGNRSGASNEKQGNTFVSGLYYEHSTGIWFDLDSIDWSHPEYTGLVQRFSLTPKVQEEYFNFRFDGYVFLTKAGSYQFRTGSDDGSRLKIDDKVLVDNDGVHTFKIITSAATMLSAGAHRITVDFFEYNESDSLLVQFNGPENNNQWTEIPPSSLKSSESVITSINPETNRENFIISVYPNPATHENINLKLESTLSEQPVRVKLIDPVGKSVFQDTFQPGDLVRGAKLTTDEKLSRGIYIIHVTQGETTIRQRLVVTE